MFLSSSFKGKMGLKKYLLKISIEYLKNTAFFLIASDLYQLDFPETEQLFSFSVLTNPNSKFFFGSFESLQRPRQKTERRLFGDFEPNFDLTPDEENRAFE